MYRLFVATLAAVLLTGSSSALMAQEDKPRMHRGMHMMQKWDTDGNGELSKDEFMQAHERMFDAMDENGDGTLDRQELEAMMSKMRHHKGSGSDRRERMKNMEHRQMKHRETSEPAGT